MSHRIALVGSDPLRLKALESELKLAGGSVITATSAEGLAPLTRQLRPSVLVCLVAVDDPKGAQLIAQLLIHPATSAVPCLVATPRLEPKSAVRAYRAGVVDVVVGSPTGKALIERADAILGPTDDDPRRRAAIDRRGPTVLRRIGDFLRSYSGSGVLAIRTDEQDANIRFEGGQIKHAKYGNNEGGDAIRSLLAHPTRSGWDFLLLDEAPEPELEIVVDLDDLEVYDELEIIVDDEMPTSPGLPTAPSTQAALRVLLADDDADLLNLYTTFMRKQGWHVESAENGRRAYDLAVHHRPDVIVSDIMMPESDGWGFLTSVRDDYRLREIPFLLLSCHGDYLHNLERLDAGADDYLEKGLRGDEVIRRVQEAAKSRSDLRGSIDPSVPMSGQVENIGARLLLTLLSEQRATGALEIRAGWLEITIKLHQGRMIEMTSVLGKHVETGEVALRRYLNLDGGTFMFLPLELTAGTSVIYFPDVADDLCVSLNRQREQEREQMLADDTQLVFDEGKLAFYETVCADPIRPITNSLRDGNRPRSVMVESGASPVLVEWVIKDLLRKGIARFA